MFQNTKWVRFILFATGCIVIVATAPLIGVVSFGLWAGILILVLQQPLRRWLRFRVKSTVPINPQQIKAAPAEEKVEDMMLVVLVCVMFVMFVLDLLLRYDIIP